MRAERLTGQLIAFGFVGAVGFVLDAGLFNLLESTVFSAHAMHGGPLYAKAISTSVAITANWAGNRWLTFRDHRRPDVLREAVEFALVSVAGSLIAVVCLGFSHYGLHLTTPLADNLSANVAGLVLGSAFRFVAYRYWVYGARRPHTAAESISVSA